MQAIVVPGRLFVARRKGLAASVGLGTPVYSVGDEFRYRLRRRVAAERFLLRHPVVVVGGRIFLLTQDHCHGRIPVEAERESRRDHRLDPRRPRRNVVVLVQLIRVNILVNCSTAEAAFRYRATVVRAIEWRRSAPNRRRL
jgi:hypothetical protein